MPTDQFANQRATAQPNGVGTDPVQAKLSALLDDVTVQAAQAAQAAQAQAELPLPPLEKAPSVPTAEENSIGEQPVTPDVAQIAAQIKSIQAAANHTAGEEVAKPARVLGAGAVTIKGRSNGVVIEIGKGHWAEILAELSERLDQSGSFFRGGSVALDVGARPLLEAELEEVRKLLSASGLGLGVVRTSAERTFEAAIALGLAAQLSGGGEQEAAEVEPSGSNQGFARYFVYRGNLRSGQILERKEHILVIGDVNPGAELVSQGDVLVWGRMRGIAHAGSGGDRRAVVVALHLDPIQLRVAGLFAIDLTQPERGGRRPRKSSEKRPEIAYIANEQIVIEPWDESKPGGLAAFRR
jgi:septum site-determining protein MinC